MSFEGTTSLKNDSIKWSMISEIKPFTKNINIQFILLKKLDSKVQNFQTWLVADQSGSINFSCPLKISDLLKPGDIIRVMDSYSAIIEGGFIQLNGNCSGNYKRIGNYFMTFCENPNYSKICFL